MQAMPGEDFRARTKESTHQLSEVLEGVVRGPHIRVFTISQDFQQIHLARHSVRMDNHVIASTPTQQSEPRRPKPCRVSNLFAQSTSDNYKR